MIGDDWWWIMVKHNLQLGRAGCLVGWLKLLEVGYCLSFRSNDLCICQYLGPEGGWGLSLNKSDGCLVPGLVDVWSWEATPVIQETPVTSWLTRHLITVISIITTCYPSYKPTYLSRGYHSAAHLRTPWRNGIQTSSMNKWLITTAPFGFPTCNASLQLIAHPLEPCLYFNSTQVNTSNIDFARSANSFWSEDPHLSYLPIKIGDAHGS